MLMKKPCCENLRFETILELRHQCNMVVIRGVPYWWWSQDRDIAVLFILIHESEDSQTEVETYQATVCSHDSASCG